MAAVAEPVGWQAVALLLAAGVAAVPAYDVDATRLPHPERRTSDAPPFSLDDLIDLHTALDTPDWFAGLTDGPAVATTLFVFVSATDRTGERRPAR